MVASVGPSKIRRIGRKKGATLRDVRPWRWVAACARWLQRDGRLLVPRCADYVKTSHGRERAPQRADWYFVRCAAVLRALALRPGGYGGLSKRFSNKKNRGSRPEITTRASKGLLHWCCKSLTKIGLVEKCAEAGHRVTKKGRKLTDALAFQVHVRRFNTEKQQAE